MALSIVGLLLVLWFAQRRLIYFPFGPTVPRPAEAGLDSAREVTLNTDDGIHLGAWFVEPRRPRSAGRWSSSTATPAIARCARRSRASWPRTAWPF